MTEVAQQMANRSGSPRFVQWVAFLLFSTITLGSTVNMVNHVKEGSARTASERWALTMSSFTFILTLTTVIMHLHPILNTYINGTKIEGGICLALVGFWIITVAIITDSKYDLAVNETGAVSNGNLYYFSWAGFVCSVSIFIQYLQHVFQLDVAGEIQSRAARLNYWSGLLTTSLVVMGSSLNVHGNFCWTGEASETYCARAKYGIALGTVATLVGAFIVASKIALRTAPFVVEAGLGTLMMIMYVFGVIFITEQQGPGAPLGNLYYFTWLSFLVSCLITASCFEDYQASKAAGANNASENGGVDADPQDIDVENLDDDHI